MKPPVTIDVLMAAWAEDTHIDASAMEKELLKISHLHGKYLNVMSYHRHLVRKMKGLREDYYQGHLTKEELDERGWEPMQHVLTNPQIARKLETDTELNKLLLKKVAHEEIVSYCEGVLKSLHNRTWDLGNYTKYLQLTSGK
jgi:hypothetical protein